MLIQSNDTMLEISERLAFSVKSTLSTSFKTVAKNTDRSAD